MLPNFLFPETEVRKDGEGPVLALENATVNTLQLTLGITEAVEQESLDVLVFGSTDGTEWGAKPLLAFQQKFYTGTYTMLLDLSATPDVRFLKVKYKAARWGHWTTGPQFKFYVFAEALAA
jgi:hypothetical protein